MSDCARCDGYVRKKDRRRCSHCGSPVCVRHSFIRVDESNESITRNSPLYCGPCAYLLEPRYV